MFLHNSFACTQSNQHIYQCFMECQLIMANQICELYADKLGQPVKPVVVNIQNWIGKSDMFWQPVIFSGLCSISYLNKASNTLYYQHLNYLKSWLGKYWTILSIVPVNYVKTNILWPACRSARDWHPVSDFKITNSHIPEWKTCRLKTRKRTKSKVVDKKLESKFLYTYVDYLNA